jgi:hypothetical protein
VLTARREFEKIVRRTGRVPRQEVDGFDRTQANDVVVYALIVVDRSVVVPTQVDAGSLTPRRDRSTAGPHCDRRLADDRIVALTELRWR